MEIIKLSDKEYYNCDDLIKKDKEFFKNCELKIRNVIKWKKIPADKYIYGYKVDGNWKKSNAKYNKSKLLLLREYCDNNIKLLEEEEKIEEKQEEEIKKNNKINKKLPIKKTEQKINKVIEEIQEENKNEDEVEVLEKLPPLIELKDDEKFKDENNLPLDIEVRGIREHDKIYFKCADIMIAFNMLNLNSTILHKNSDYVKNIDYVVFIGLGRNQSDKKLFITFEGMIKILYVSRNKKASQFRKWATKILFTHQMGTLEQKNKLVSQIKGVSYESIQELFSINARELPCVYLTAFNTVGKLRNIMNIDNKYKDDDIVYKFGLTKSFENRKNGHKSEYKNIEKYIDMKLVQFTYIDPLYISEAENEIKNLLEEYKIKYDNFTELIVIPNNILKIVKTIYENIGMKYSGHTSDFNKKIADLNLEIIKLQNKLELKDKELELKDKDIEILRKELYIKKLELEIACK
jgi:hypothetical protein